MHLTCLFLLICTLNFATSVERTVSDATVSSTLARLPFFGGGVGQLLRYIRPLDTVNGNQRRSELRSELDINYISYRGSQLWKLNFNATRMVNDDDEDEDDVNQKTSAIMPGPTDAEFSQMVERYGTEVWNINQDGIDILIDQKNVAAAREFMDKASFSYNIMIDDIEKAIDETYTEAVVQDSGLMELNNNSHPWMEREGVLMTWRRYHDHADIQQFLQNILETHSDLVEIIQIGLTRNKRPLEVLRVSNGNPNNWAIFVDAGLQARDWLSPAAVTYAISKLTWLWSMNELDRHMRHIDWYFLPITNPDGYQYSRLTDRLWTKNRNYDSSTGCYGVNLDRNFDQGWSQSGGSSANPCKNLYSGSNSFTEIETRAMRNFLVSLGKDYLGAYISFGGYGQSITYPWGDADYVTENQRQLKQTGREAVRNLRRLNHAEYSLGTSYRQKLARPGNSADWVQQRIEPQFVYNVFLKDQGRYGYLMPPHYIVESGEEAYDFLSTIAKNLK
ncbi:uncharacterized protein Dwil_GK25780 [Drosophila willistoni]|uniref:Peptidase M14 domain-containing protein n=1 Tax=Drosophila willistoni TaxID=7260 RepID=B4NC34_DROWI|nr:carboxypeptidase B [Drosophila willistoni]EDW82393.2 uncharacterized protein Dwil_GK25780 [Drosophila willistoni]